MAEEVAAAAKMKAKEDAAAAKKKEEAPAKATKKDEEDAAAAEKEKEVEAAKNQKEEAAAAQTNAHEIDGLAEAIARASLGAAALSNAAAWIAAAGAHSVAQLEPDDIDGAPSSHGRRCGLRMRGPGRACLFVCLRWSGAVLSGAELVASLSLPKIPARELKRALAEAAHVRVMDLCTVLRTTL